MNKGFLLVNKPVGISSYEVIRKIKKITGIKKVGHAGVLDPLAEGLLIVGIQREYTKKLSSFLKLDKEYIATLKLGEISDTYDKNGKIIKQEIKEIPSLYYIKKVLKEFIGEINQVPPVYSNKKIKGKKARELIRKNKKITLPPQKVKIYKIEVLNYKFPYLTIKVFCSSGTYIRSLANDIGEKLKTGAILVKLIRTKIGNYSLNQAVKLADLNESNWNSYLIDQ